ncbi:response regulator [Pseudoroseomonas ludipueritiae]|uniref:Response regulator n=1 Tax=Pseudoroseomonas ludipueritiae TaxID=198093 RepID=A0ABR7RA91_9PROT|nr:response regulator [Pseudoroseomonas ludipueritiae]MBC9178412.1 response regulator [Pseudoroseomonas ludipueritiae]
MKQAYDVDLSGRMILVLEDEYIIASEFSEALRRAGAVVIGPFPRVKEGLAAVRTGTPIDCAVLDVNLGGERVWPLVDALPLGMPVILTTGYEAGEIPATYAHLPRMEKPVPAGDLIRAVAEQARLQRLQGEPPRSAFRG